MPYEEDEDMTICSRCNGTGQVEVNDPEEGTFRVTCSKCNGFGSE
jgi:DnaJ-class molecular chaperone